MNHERLVSKFSQTVGVEKAAAIVDDALEALDLEAQSSYSPRELEELCTTIEERNDGYIPLVAHEIVVQQQARQRFEALLERISDPVVVVEFEDERPVVTWMNPAFQGTFGYDSTAVGRDLTDLIVPDDEADDPTATWLGGSSDVELRRKTADGDVRTFIFRPVIVTRTGGRIEGYGIYVDITDRKRHERMLANQNEQLERFASVVSHDLRNPLNVADGHLELALEAVDDPDVREHLEHVTEAHERMSDLIETLLTLAREGQTVDDPSPVPIGCIAGRAWAHVDTGDATLETDALEGAVVAADADRFEQLLANIVRNAIEHGTTGDSSTEDASAGAASTVTVEIGLLRDGDDPIGFYVEDDGRGVPESDRGHVFDHGYSTAADGTGFGLAIVETVAEAHGWSVSLADPADGRGARFEFSGVEFVDSN